MSKSRWFKFNTGDFLGGTQGWTATQCGAYMFLLIAAWDSKDGTLPGDEVMLRAIARVDWGNWNRWIREVVLAKFERLPNGRIYNQRVMQERKLSNLPVADIDARDQKSWITDPRITDRSGTFSNEIIGSTAPNGPVQARAREGARTTDLEGEGKTPIKVLPSPFEEPNQENARAPSPALNGAQSRASAEQAGKTPGPEPPGSSLSEEERAAFVRNTLASFAGWNADGEPQGPRSPINGKAFPPAPRPINAATLSTEDLAKAEADAISFLAGKSVL